MQKYMGNSSASQMEAHAHTTCEKKKNHKSSENSSYPTKYPKLLLSGFQSGKTLSRMPYWNPEEQIWPKAHHINCRSVPPRALEEHRGKALQPPLLLNPDRPWALLNTLHPVLITRKGQRNPSTGSLKPSKCSFWTIICHLSQLPLTCTLKITFHYYIDRN